MKHPAQLGFLTAAFGICMILTAQKTKTPISNAALGVLMVIVGIVGICITPH